MCCVDIRPRFKSLARLRAIIFLASPAQNRLAVVDEFTRKCLSIDVGRKLKSEDVLARLTELFVQRGLPEHIHSDNGPEFTSKRERNWLSNLGVQRLFIEPGSPWENGYV
jgi:putative transposase